MIGSPKSQLSSYRMGHIRWSKDLDAREVQDCVRNSPPYSITALCVGAEAAYAFSQARLCASEARRSVAVLLVWEEPLAMTARSDCHRLDLSHHATSTSGASASHRGYLLYTHLS
jgi:hypothetical protein